MISNLKSYSEAHKSINNKSNIALYLVVVIINLDNNHHNTIP